MIFVSIFIGYVDPIHISYNLDTFWSFFVITMITSLILLLMNAPNMNTFMILVLIITASLSFINSVFLNHDTVVGRLSFEDSEDSFLSDSNEKRLIGKKNAIALAKKTIGISLNRFPDVSLGSIYSIESDLVNVDIVNGERFWIIPIDFYKYFNQDKVDNTIPGFIMVDSSSTNTQAEFVSKNKQGEDISIKMSTGMVFGNNLNRFLFENYTFKNIFDSQIRIDDDLNPHYIGYVVEGTTGYKNYNSTGLIHIDLQTLEHAFYTKEEARISLPWLEAVESSKMNDILISDWAYYRESSLPFLNAPSSILSSSDISFIETDYGNTWFTNISSNSDSDDSIVGMVGVNTVTGKAYYHRLKSGGGNSNAARNSVRSLMGKEREVWSTGDAIPYNLLGKHPSYIVPVTSNSTDMFMGVGIVNIEHTNKSVFHKGNDFETAMAKYIQSLNVDDSFVIEKSSLIQLGGVVDTIHVISISDIPYFYVTLESNSKVLRCDGHANKGCFKLKEGRKLEFDVTDNGDGFSLIKEIRVLTDDVTTI